ncbi:lasso peptide biosynthesis B2 protein [Rhodococcus sp. BP-349]|uniref:lasso peptide biosynthesis B2 protein n=1 Tax=unclassified Rhodococcus (in: high G+C Gram-positive bacteria) TaxID=192944 RepID=UPI001C9AFC6C|nr:MULTISPECIES: lasso peptide biosynthesis B2 protein [unclassified Rhodococcus (in: high G+C Gram-positive bacteria)]MBY6539457.1 lasso peptide biosynthesis B2 protein [Rhodococcus sp. BP-363]MBY6544215.1 lasso peptide biosynthesis B2 protein [Rhodococcus sp. BP-369]MBY6563445.1 lasso peptide biosynthesis B2 protein [Rhodococcus sp. BP-370]MBY6577737.1 lasso peptide biosynthesis B2 protein [Rhodococcus sp. BP-364]MBY6587038.1 lasso peptide biosynthesis B2 protein [Rhodococcus sp. BP-358]
MTIPEDLATYLRTPRSPRWSPHTVRAAWWVCRAYYFASRDLKTDGVRTVVRPPPDLPAGARRGVDAALRRLDPTCLQRSLIKQRWLAGHGVSADVMIGVDKSDATFAAHAWLDYESTYESNRFYRIIHRIPAQVTRQ